MAADRVDVLIAGGGPTGTALAVDLARRGVSVRILDKAERAFAGSRAKGIQPRSLEVLEDLGVLDDILAGGSGYPLMGIHLGPFTIPWRMQAQHDASTEIPYPNTWLIPQHRTDAALHARLETLGRGVEFGRELIAFEQDADQVVATVRHARGTEEVTARYLVGADGGSSAVRKGLGIGFSGSTDEADRILLVDAEVSGLRRDRWHVWPGLGGRFVGACPLPHSGRFQWMIRLRPDEDPPSDGAAVLARIRAQTRDERIRLSAITWTSVFRPNIRLADCYRSGRVFIAGDAAHVHTPAGAQGLNTGIQDAYNLGWKLGQVLAGAPEALLDSYAAERLPIAAGVLKLSTGKYEGLGKLDPSSIKRGKDESQLAISYHGGPLASHDAQRTATLRVGDRAPDAKLLSAAGGPQRLFDIMRGPHFTVLGFGAEAAAELTALHWPESGAVLRRVAVDAGPAADAEVVLADISGGFARSYGLAGPALLVIRPDGYLASITVGNDRVRITQAAVHSMVPTRTRGASVSGRARRKPEGSE
ncbi:FAD-dependent monooxygenase [Nocardia wallacei]|uniref:FAD-dependent monooxygenase n=1 Tax=Nocardia wallacei TaxID=480035 RepID=UPI002457D561|nr:FAD-dependent monooxygenase [Nocardia wallacei]